MPATLSDMTWHQYVRDTIGTDQQIDAARKTGLDQTTISRWIRGGQAGRVENVARFARGYHRPVLEAFLAAGFLSSEDARAQVTITRHEDPSDGELLELLRRRLERDRQESESRGDTAPMTPEEEARHRLLDELDDHVTLGELRATAQAIGGPVTGDDLAHHRRKTRARRIARDEEPAAARPDEE